MRQALEMALEALALAKSSHNMVLTSDPPQNAWRYYNVDTKIRDAITTIKEALAQPEQIQPSVDLNTHQPEQEPRAWINWSALTGEPRLGWECESELASEPLYTTPPQRKPLTNGEIYTAYITATNQTLRAQDERLALAFARAIEAAHGIK